MEEAAAAAAAAVAAGLIDVEACRGWGNVFGNMNRNAVVLNSLLADSNVTANGFHARAQSKYCPRDPKISSHYKTLFRFTLASMGSP
jgi:hypothetical protein